MVNLVLMIHSSVGFTSRLLLSSATLLEKNKFIYFSKINKSITWLVPKLTVANAIQKGLLQVRYLFIFKFNFMISQPLKICLPT